MIPKFDAVETVKNETNVDTSSVVASDESLERLGRYIDGAEQTIQYYKLIQNTNDVATTLDPNIPVTEQQYLLYKDTVIRVTTPLEVESLMEMSGEAILPKDIVPNIGDYLTMRLLDGSIGIFRVYNVDYKAYNKNKKYTIQYKIDTTSKINKDRYENLLSKVVKHYIFVNSNETASGSKLLTDDDYQYEQYLKYQCDNLFRIYKDRYLDENNYFTVIIDNTRYYDPYITELLSYVVSLDTDINLNIVEDSYIKYLLNPSKTLLSKVKLYYTSPRGYSFIRTAFRLNNRLPANIDFIVNTFDSFTPLNINSNNETLFPNVNSIYDLDSNSLFTFILNGFIDNDILDRGKLKELIDYCENSNNDVSMYWYIPYILLFIKYSLERNYSTIDIK